MARAIRVEFENAVYHVTARGNERKAIYRDDRDRERFLETLEETVNRFGIIIHTYCLMPNHFHLLVQTPRANLSDAAGWLQTTYSIRFNRRHRRSGHLYQGRYKAHLVEEDAYARVLIKYIHLNPVRPKDKRKRVPRERKRELTNYRWSTHRAYAGFGKTVSPEWVCMDWLRYFGRTRRVAQNEYRRQIDMMFGEVVSSPWKDLRGGLVLGGKSLWDKVSQLVADSEGDEDIRWHRGASAEETKRLIHSLVEQETDRRIAIWLRVRLGGERMTIVAKDYDYSDGSGVHRVLQRLEEKAKHDRSLSRHLNKLTKRLSSVKS